MLPRRDPVPRSNGGRPSPNDVVRPSCPACRSRAASTSPIAATTTAATAGSWLPDNAAERARRADHRRVARGGRPGARPGHARVGDLRRRAHAARRTSPRSSSTSPPRRPPTRSTPTARSSRREIAQLLRRKGSKMIAVYGATRRGARPRHARRRARSRRCMEGFARLREAGAGFTVQLIPMRGNWHEWEAMEELAKSLSKHWRVGPLAVPERLRRRGAQRRDRRAAPRPGRRGRPGRARPLGRRAGAPTLAAPRSRTPPTTRLFARCIAGRRDFHVDPYGGMTWCCFVKDPELRYDLRAGAPSRRAAAVPRRRHRAGRRGRRLGGVHPVAGRQGARRRRVPRGLRRLRAARRLPLVRRVRLPGARPARGQGRVPLRGRPREPRLQGASRARASPLLRASAA